MYPRSIAALALFAAALPASSPAQMVQPLGLTDADLLAAQMRQLGANPRDVQALATAGELSLRVGDLSGAAALFARADKVDPRNGRVKAGMASILVRSERPGEALRFYQQAESYGWTAARFAADRGLAYDLIGQQERAQRDYRVALKAGSDDETVRRYALSLGISGRQKEALEQLDPLVRKQDRAAWRARAFVMAMAGDGAGAAKIATGMMPAGMAQGLSVFLQRLPSLGPVDRAFAVHFGEVYATPERIADARLIPALPVLAPEPGIAPVQVAAATVVQPVPVEDRRARRDRERRERSLRADAQREARQRDRRGDRALAPAVAVAQATPVRPAPVQLAQVQPLPTRAAQPTRNQPARTLPPTQTPTAAPAPVAAAATMRETDVRVAAAPTAIAAIPPATTDRPPATVRPTSTPVATASVPAPLPASAPVATASVPAPVPVSTAAIATPQAVPAPVVTAIPPVAIGSAPVAAIAPAPVAPVQSAAATERADSVLARIVASLSIPASELGVAAARPDPDPVPVPAAVARAPSSAAGRRIVAEASAKEARDATLRRTVAARLTGDAQADEPAATTRRGRRGARVAETEVATAEPAARGRRGARTTDEPLDPKAKRAADRKAVADRKAAAEKKAVADAEAAEKKAARARPARIWVQVAGGANEGDLSKAWRAAQAKAPALKGKSGYSTPLRATNRVLTGPFKTDAEARAAVNQLSKQGLSAFTFTSDAGQDVKKLGGK